MNKVTKMTVFKVPEMSCGHCKSTVEKAIASLDPTSSVEVDLENRTARITSVASDQDVVAALQKAGYDSNIVQP